MAGYEFRLPNAEHAGHATSFVDRLAGAIGGKGKNGEIGDPAKGITGMPPNMGQGLLPHVVTFQGIMSTISRVYRPSDEAIKESWDNARYMLNDPMVTECLDQRRRSTALLEWHLEPDDEKDPTQVWLAEELKLIIEQTPRFAQYRECLLYALWYGRYANQHRYRWKKIRGKQRLCVERWRPVHGDKLVFRYDDGTGEYDPDQVGIRVGAGFTTGGPVARDWNTTRHEQVEPTDYGLAYFLKDWERPLLAIHKHQIEDGEYEEPRSAGKIHGLGIRSKIYWLWYQKQEALAFLMEFLERSATGFEIWYYPSGNPQAEEKTRTAAEQRIGEARNVILVPRPLGDDSHAYDVQRIEPSMAGADALKDIIVSFYGHLIKRTILGQILTSESDATGLGSNLASIHLDTYLQIVKYDATNLEETLTTEMVEPLKRFNFPAYQDVPIRFRINTEAQDIEGKLKGMREAYDMGLKLRAQDLMDLLGTQKPDADEDVLENPIHQQAKMQQQQMAQQGAMMQAQAAAASQPPPATPPADPAARDASAVHDNLTLTDELNRKGMHEDQFNEDGSPKVENAERERLRREGEAERYRTTSDVPDWLAESGKKPAAEKGGGDTGWHGNFHVDESGEVDAGCPGVKGEHISDIGKGETPEHRKTREHRQDVADAKGLKGHHLAKHEVEKLEEEPHPKTGKPARENRAEPAPEPQPAQPPVPRPKRDPALNPKARFQAAVAATAEDYGVDPGELAEEAKFAVQFQREYVQEREAAKQGIRESLGVTAQDLGRLENAGFDVAGDPRKFQQQFPRLAAKIRSFGGFDSMATSLAAEYPGLLGNAGHDDVAANLWNVIREGVQPAPQPWDQDVLRLAANRLLAARGDAGGAYEFETAGAVGYGQQEFARSGVVERYGRWREATAPRAALTEAFQAEFNRRKESER